MAETAEQRAARLRRAIVRAHHNLVSDRPRAARLVLEQALAGGDPGDDDALCAFVDRRIAQARARARSQQPRIQT